jgi:transposase-like protein
VRGLEAYARRSKDVDRLILACFLLGLSTRKVGEALQTILGEKVSPATVSRISQTLDAAVNAFHKRRLCKGLLSVLPDMYPAIPV